MTHKRTSLRVGLTHEIEVSTNDTHTAHTLGNPGVHVLATIFLVGFVEECCGWSVQSHLAKNEATVGTRVNLAHRAPALAGAELSVRSRLTQIQGNHLKFEASVFEGKRLLMNGVHHRAIIDTATLLEIAGGNPKYNSD